MQLKQMTWDHKHLRDMTRDELMHALAQCIDALDVQTTADWRKAMVLKAAAMPHMKGACDTNRLEGA